MMATTREQLIENLDVQSRRSEAVKERIRNAKTERERYALQVIHAEIHEDMRQTLRAIGNADGVITRLEYVTDQLDYVRGRLRRFKEDEQVLTEAIRQAGQAEAEYLKDALEHTKRARVVLLQHQDQVKSELRQLKQKNRPG